MSISAVSSIDTQYTVLLDQVSSTLSYIGEAAPKSTTSAAVWRIRRLNTASGIELFYADGDTRFDNIWDNRASLIYTS